MISGIPSVKCTRGPEYTRGGSRQLCYFSTLTHSLPILELARELRYKWSSLLLVTLCLSCVVCVRGEGVFPSIYTRLEAVLEAILSMKLSLHRLCIPSCHRQTKGRQRGAGRGSPAPRGWPPPDLAPSPPPSRGGLWTGPRPLLGWYFIWMN